MRRILLDTNMLNALSGCTETELSNLNKDLKSNGCELCVTHIQVDERYAWTQCYETKVEKLIQDIINKGLNISTICTNIAVVGFSRVDLAKIGGFENNFYKELLECLNKCEKGKTQENITRDAIIGTSSLECDVFITGDANLKKELIFLLNKYSEKLKKTPTVVRRNPRKDNILNEIKCQIQNIGSKDTS